MRTRDHEELAPLVNLADITAIELVVLKRMRELTLGDHRSRAQGSGFDFQGLREWQPGDKFSYIDWAQSSLNNFSPLVIREFEQPSTATIMPIADFSPSTRCGAGGVPIAAVIARAIAILGMSANFFQDPFGLVTFDRDFEHLAALRPRLGKSHVVHCVDAYQYERGLQHLRRSGSISTSLGGFVRRQAMLPIISDFLFDDVEDVIKELSLLGITHDVFMVMVDSAFAFDLPKVPAGWIEISDVETGRTRTVSRRQYAQLAERARTWQDTVRARAGDLDIDLVTLGLDQAKNDVALTEFVVERRLRKTHE
ncbi:MAG: DUF58 domain-containing protein [Acidobacteria bacterium]|nr:DUF58 domain-containing protein [Acidobacteriota bacterium]